MSDPVEKGKPGQQATLPLSPGTEEKPPTRLRVASPAERAAERDAGEGRQATKIPEGDRADVAKPQGKGPGGDGSAQNKPGQNKPGQNKPGQNKPPQDKPRPPQGKHDASAPGHGARKAGEAHPGHQQGQGKPNQPKEGPKDNQKKRKPVPSIAAETQASLEQRRKAQETVAQLRRQRSRSLLVRLALFVLLPTLIMTGYAAFVASDSYESVAMFSIQSADSNPGIAMEGLIGLAGANPSSRDTLAAREYVLSREMLGVLNEKMDLLKKYRSQRVDFFSRLPADASVEDAYDYYLKKIRVGYDSNSGVLTLSVRAFSAEDARRATELILQACEDKVNLLSDRARQDSIAFAESELKKAEKRLTESRTELVALQQERGEFSPQQTAEAALSIRTQLESELANARAEYATLSSYMAENSPQVIAARQRVASLAAQAKSESKRLVAPDSDGLNSSLVEFERVLVEKEFATHAYQSALTSLELARSDAARQHRYLATIAEPSLPDEAQYPRRFILVLTTFLVALVAFGIGSLGWAAIKEHARLS